MPACGDVEQVKTRSASTGTPRISASAIGRISVDESATAVSQTR
jgi:hypothetical protein